MGSFEIGDGLDRYDTIILVQSDDELSNIVFDYLRHLIPHEYEIENSFEELTADDVYEGLIDDNYIESHFNEPNIIYNAIDEAFMKMHMENNGKFSYRYIVNSKYYNEIIHSMRIKDYPSCGLIYAPMINGKDIMIVDSKTISDSAKAIKDMFAPKSITFVTLFSALTE